MLGNLRGRLAMVAALALACGSAGGFTQPAPTVQLNAPRKAKRGLFGGYSTSYAPMTYGHKGAGITMAQQQRNSRKRRNVKRHRAASRG
jgi:hypothetical protein